MVLVIVSFQSIQFVFWLSLILIFAFNDLLDCSQQRGFFKAAARKCACVQSHVYTQARWCLLVCVKKKKALMWCEATAVKRCGAVEPSLCHTVLLSQQIRAQPLWRCSKHSDVHQNHKQPRYNPVARSAETRMGENPDDTFTPPPLFVLFTTSG